MSTAFGSRTINSVLRSRLRTLSIKQDIGSNKYGASRQMSTQSEPKAKRSIRAAYTQETDPSKHTMQHEGLFYTMSPEVRDRIIRIEGLRVEQYEMLDFFGESSIMIRKPALDIINYLEKTNFSLPVNRYVMYGTFGNGKTFSLNHVLHYGLMKQFLLIHCSAVSTNWFHRPQDVAPSESRPGRLDLPMDSAMWLQQFRSRNASLLPKLNLKTSQKYTWSLRETTEEGEPLVNVIDHGISRMKHASDCVAVLLKELKKSANEGSCRILFTCDLANSFYNRTIQRHPDKNEAAVEHFTIGRAFKKLFVNDWRNGAVVAGVDNKPYFNKNAREWRFKGRPDLPKHLLTEKGFKDFDPFIPIKVPKYTEKEMENCLDYYTEKMLLQRAESWTPAGRQEIKFLSTYSPLELYKLASSL